MQEEDWARLREIGNGQFMEMVSCYRRSGTGKVYQRTRKELLEAVAESLCAMANANGGKVLLGVGPEGETPGTFFREGETRAFHKALGKSFSPPLSFQSAEEEAGGKKLAQFSVLPSPQIHSLGKGRVYLRVGDENISLSREKIARLREARSETWHEREILPDTSLEDLDGELVEGFLARAGAAGDPAKALHRPYALLEYREGKALINRAAAYLLGRDPLRWHARPGLEFVRFGGMEKKSGAAYNVLERIRLELPILKLIGEAEKLIGERLERQVLSRDLFFREKFQYPALCWKEGLINAVAHRDYSLEGRAVEVWMFDDRMEIRSPGRLPRLKAGRILDGRGIYYPRNPLIARVLTDAGFMQSRGEGLPRIFQEMDRQGLKPPECREEGDFFSLVFENTPILNESTAAWLKQFSRYSLNPRQTRILAYSRMHGGTFSSSDYQKFGVDRDGAYTEIQELIRQGIVEPFRKRGKLYRVKETG